MNEGIIALMIPVIAILGGCGIAIFSMYSETRKRELLHNERKIALEKGLPLPDDFKERKNPETRHKNAALVNRKVFVILFFIGLAFAWFFPDNADPSGRFIGAVLILLSFAFLIISTFKYKMSPEEKELYKPKSKF
ncbi:hypothetical protein J7L05_04810, partial [bacterium]|nr:hypothetical protein [bacterium]